MPSEVTGSCYCKRIRFELKLTKPFQDYGPRACDCSFCTKHGAAYLSDSQGSLHFFAKDAKDLHSYAQEGTNGLASFLSCSRCQVLMGVIYKENGQTWGAVNTLAIDGGVKFGEKLTASPKKLSDEEKIKRWKEVWFPQVGVKTLS